MKITKTKATVCAVCRKVNTEKKLCKSCIENPFRVEDYRSILASKANYKSLLGTYNGKYPEIKNLNTGNFWDSRLNNNLTLNTQDGMTKDRVKTVYNFIPKSAKTILDIGSGYGFIEELLSLDRTKKLFAIDISKVAIQYLRKRFKGSFELGTIYNLKYKKNFFDQVLLLEVLEHIPPSKTLRVLRKINSLTKKNGFLIVSVPLNENLENMESNPNGHLRIYTKKLLYSELYLSGFRVIKQKELYAFKNFYYLKKKLTLFLKKKWKPNNIVVLTKKI